MNLEISSLFGLIVLALDVWAIIRIINSGAGNGSKVLWVLLVLFLPAAGLILWWFFGPK